jgi:broad specificity phosphatase PhoE
MPVSQAVRLHDSGRGRESIVTVTGDKHHRTRVILVRHARPVIAPDRPASTWALADDVRREVEDLAGAIRRHGADGVVASPEAKARGTAEIMATRLDLPLILDAAFREQGGDRVPFLDDEAFYAAVAEHFERSNEVVFGEESSAQAAQRFAAGVDQAHGRFARPIVVTHGRAMCAWVARALGVDPLPIWRALRLPDAFVVDVSEGTLERIEPSPHES